MNLKEMGIDTSNRVDSTEDIGYWKALACECGIKPPGFISHGVSQFYSYYHISRDVEYRVKI